MEDNGIHWWKTPAESPDLNPIENLWAEMKSYLRSVIKPTTKDALVNGILQYWETVDEAKCTKYINHLRKVVPAVVKIRGYPAGY